MQNEAKYIEFDAFLENTLSAKEKLVFEKKLETNASFKQEFLNYKFFKANLHDAFFKEKLNTIHQKTITKKDKKIYYPYIIVAASFLLLIGFLFSKDWFNPSQKIYNTYFTPDPGLPNVMGAITTNYAFNDAMIDYKLGNTKKALKVWDSLLIIQPKNDTLQYFTAMANLNLNNYAIAKEKLLKLLKEHPNTAFKKESKWYVSLLYIKENNYTEALSLLKELPQVEATKTLIKKLE